MSVSPSYEVKLSSIKDYFDLEIENCSFQLAVLGVLGSRKTIKCGNKSNLDDAKTTVKDGSSNNISEQTIEGEVDIELRDKKMEEKDIVNTSNKNENIGNVIPGVHNQCGNVVSSECDSFSSSNLIHSEENKKNPAAEAQFATSPRSHSVINVTNPNPEEENSEASADVCRFCYGDDSDGELVSLCKCSGTIKLVHKSCMEMWITSNYEIENKCRLCRTKIPVIITRKPISQHLPEDKLQYRKCFFWGAFTLFGVALYGLSYMYFLSWRDKFSTLSDKLKFIHKVLASPGASKLKKDELDRFIHFKKVYGILYPSAKIKYIVMAIITSIFGPFIFWINIKFIGILNKTKKRCRRYRTVSLP